MKKFLGSLFFLGFIKTGFAMDEPTRNIMLKTGGEFYEFFSKKEYEEICKLSKDNKEFKLLFDETNNSRNKFVQNNQAAIFEREYLRKMTPLYIEAILRGVIRTEESTKIKTIIQNYYLTEVDKVVQFKRLKILDTKKRDEFKHIFDLLVKYQGHNEVVKNIVNNKTVLEKTVSALYKKGKTKVFYATLGACSLFAMACIKIALKKYRGSTV